MRGDKGLLEEEEDCVGTWVTRARNEWGGATIDGAGARFGPPSTAQEEKREMVTSPFSDARSLYQICTTNQTNARLCRLSLFIQPNTEGLH